MKPLRWLSLIGGAAAVTLALPAMAQNTVVNGQFRSMTFAVFGALVLFTLAVTWWAARRNRSVGDFYTGGGGISGLKNGLAISGDYLSAAAFLGVSGLIALYGFDGILYVVGFFVGFIPVLLLIAEPCRNLGRYTLSDVLAFRNGFRSSKTAGAISSVCVAIFYLIPQVVGGGVIIKALVGIEYEVSVLLVGALMLVYVLFGGMRATTWVQLIKAVLLISSCFLLVMFSWAPFGFDIPQFMQGLVHSDALTAHMKSMFPAQAAGAELNQHFFQPGLYLKNPMEQLSLGLALVLGTAAMPHVLMRFFTVRDAVTARSSVLWAMLGIGVCHVLIVFIGFAAAYYIGSPTIASFDKGGNLAAPLLAQYLGGGAESWVGNFMLAFTAAVAFATIVAVVAGLTLAAASALAHDIYVGAICHGKATERQQAVAARVSTLFVGVLAIVVSLLAKGQNVAHLVGLAYAVAASANLPALLLTLYWKHCNTWGVLAGVIGGTVLAIALVLVSPNMTYPAQVRQAALESVAQLQLKLDALTPDQESQRAALFTQQEQARVIVQGIAEDATSMVGLREPLVALRNPGLISIPAGFLLVILFSLLFRDPRSQSMWAEMSVRQHTGIGIAAAEAH
jgi:cation/acetate symporter